MNTKTFSRTCLALLAVITTAGCASTLDAARDAARDVYTTVTAADHRKQYYSDKPVVLFLLDTSESMLIEDGGETRLAIAKRSIIDTISQVDSDRYNTGLVTFNRFVDCKADVAVEPGNPDPNNVVERIRSVGASGKTPLAQAIAVSGKILKNIEQRKLVIVFSDGDETCGGNPAFEAERLADKYGIELNMQVIGYSVNRSTEAMLRRIAASGEGWGYYSANDQIELSQVINQIAVQAGVLDTIWQDTTTATFEFNPGSAEIGTEYDEVLATLERYLRFNNRRVTVIGHTDSTGSADYNLTLSIQRANQVRDELVRRGIAGHRIAVQGRGESEPVDTNATPAGRQRNRRVVVEVAR